MTIGDRAQVKAFPKIIGLINRMNNTHVQLVHLGVVMGTFPIKEVRIRNDLMRTWCGYVSMDTEEVIVC